jgi:hypothetical protein
MAQLFNNCEGRPPQVGFSVLQSFVILKSGVDIGVKLVPEIRYSHIVFQVSFLEVLRHDFGISLEVNFLVFLDSGSELLSRLYFLAAHRLGFFRFQRVERLLSALEKRLFAVSEDQIEKVFPVPPQSNPHGEV